LARLTPTASATRFTPTASVTRVLPNGQMPLATPSPMAVAAFQAWTANPKDAYSGASASTADSSAGGSLTTSAARLPPACSMTVSAPASTAPGAEIMTSSPTATSRLASPLGSVRLASQLHQQQQPLQLYHAITHTSPALYGPSVVQSTQAGGSVEIDEADESDDDSDDGGGQVQCSPRCPPADAPKPPPGAEHPSLGSAGHAAGICKRCCFFPRGRCANGYTCEFCHYEHEKRKRKNKKKKKKDCTSSHSHVFHQHSPITMSLPVPLRATQQLATVIEESPRFLSLQAGCSPRDHSVYMCQAVDDRHQQVVMPGYPQPQGQMMPTTMLGHIVYGQTMCAPSQQSYLQAVCPQLQPQMTQATCPQLQPKMPQARVVDFGLLQASTQQARILEYGAPQSPRLRQVMSSAATGHSLPVAPPPMNSPTFATRPVLAMAPALQQLTTMPMTSA